MQQVRTQVFPAGSGNNDEWFFDYPSGTLNFIGTNLPNGVNFTGKSVYISGAYYTGIKGVAGPGTATTFTSLAVSGITTSEVLKVGTAVTISSGIVTATSYEGDGSNLSGIITQLGALSTLAGYSPQILMMVMSSCTMPHKASSLLLHR